ncbi:hypothetical protein U1Q18_051387 [Sarracenia purpurea var. burkii]
MVESTASKCGSKIRRIVDKSGGTSKTTTTKNAEETRVEKQRCGGSGSGSGEPRERERGAGDNANAILLSRRRRHKTVHFTESPVNEFATGTMTGVRPRVVATTAEVASSVYRTSSTITFNNYLLLSEPYSAHGIPAAIMTTKGPAKLPPPLRRPFRYQSTEPPQLPRPEALPPPPKVPHVLKNANEMFCISFSIAVSLN